MDDEADPIADAVRHEVWLELVATAWLAGEAFCDCGTLLGRKGMCVNCAEQEAFYSDSESE